MSKLVRHSVPPFVFAAGVLLTSGSVDAATQARNFVQNATGACQSALPVFDGQIRKRPLAVQNEGTASAFVSCSFMGTSSGVGGPRSIRDVFVYADNNTSSAVNLTCTLVDGFSGGVTTYFPTTISLPANSNANSFRWDEDDNGGNKFLWSVNVSCNLPIGTGLTLIYVYYDEDVGT